MAVLVGPAATLGNINQVHEAILAELAAHETCEVDCSNLTDVDLTFLQLLTATFKLADREGKAVSLSRPVPEVVALMERAGLDVLGAWSSQPSCTSGETRQ
ncbi:MAG: STAS domain-containing protein [Novosphingobium sp.]